MGLYRVVFSGFVNGNVFNNVLHFGYDAVDPTPEVTLAGIVNTHWIDNIKTLQTNQVNYLNINVRNVGAPGPAPFNLVVNKLGTGIAADNSDNPVMAAHIKFQTAVAGRTGRGGIQLPGISLRTSCNLGILTAATLAAWAPKFTLIMNALKQGGTQNVALSICSRSNPVSTQKSVTSISARAVLGTCRTRNYGVGA